MPIRCSEGPEAAAIRARYLLKRLGTTSEVAAAILFLLSEYLRAADSVWPGAKYVD